MGFYVRKSLKAGPFRFNLSSAGVGVSAGIPGFPRRDRAARELRASWCTRHLLPRLPRQQPARPGRRAATAAGGAASIGGSHHGGRHRHHRHGAAAHRAG